MAAAIALQIDHIAISWSAAKKQTGVGGSTLLEIWSVRDVNFSNWQAPTNSRPTPVERPLCQSEETKFLCFADLGRMEFCMEMHFSSVSVQDVQAPALL